MFKHLPRSTKHLRCCKACADLFLCGHGESSFDHGASPVKLLQACLSTSKDLECSFDHDGSPVKLMQACLSTWKDLQSNFPYCGGAVKRVLIVSVRRWSEKAGLTAVDVLWSSYNSLQEPVTCWKSVLTTVEVVQACLSTSEDLDSSFNHVGSPVKLVQACFSTWIDL